MYIITRFLLIYTTDHPFSFKSPSTPKEKKKNQKKNQKKSQRSYSIAS